MVALAVVPLCALPWLARRIVEPDRFAVEAVAADHPTPVLGAVGRRFRRRLVTVAVLAFAVSVITGPANSFVFLYAQNVVHLSGGLTAAMVVGAGVTGLVGLLVGRWLADRLGRRGTCSIGLAGLAGFGALAYAGSRPALVAGYVLGVMAGSLFAPAAGSLVAELFPTSVRASVAGWWVAAGVVGAVVGLVVFGAVADVGDRFATAALVVFVPTVAIGGLFWTLPETKGREPEQLWPDG
jgi:MFS family permease